MVNGTDSSIYKGEEMNIPDQFSENGKKNQEEPRTKRKRAADEPANLADFIWLDGELVPYERAKVHFLSPTLHYGLGVFEGIRCYATDRGPAVFRMQEHLQRFLNSIRVLGVDDLAHDLDSLRDAVCRVIFANNLAECYVRTMLYFEGPLGLNLDVYQPEVGIAVWEWDDFLGRDALKKGARMMVSSVSRMHPNAGMTKAKFSGQYVNSIIAKTIAARAGFDEAIMLDQEGYVIGCTGENLLLVINNVIYTPPKAVIMEGVTRDTILTLARDNGFTIVEGPVSREQLYFADEVFVCGTAAEVVGVREIDYRPVGEGRIGPVTRTLQKQYSDVVRGRSPEYIDWLDYMVMEPLF
jgi:branched-chain amino acid aminotransferase